MKLFKNVYGLVSLILLLSRGVLLAEDRELVLIISTHTKVFSRDSLFAKRNEETNQWYAMLDYLQGYVDENAGKDKKLLEAFALCKDVSNQLINTLKIIYNSVFAGTKSPSQAVVINARSSIEKLKKRRTDLENMSNILEGTHYFFKKKKEVKKTLLRLILALDPTINKLGIDFKKQSNKELLSTLLDDYDN